METIKIMTFFLIGYSFGVLYEYYSEDAKLKSKSAKNAAFLAGSIIGLLCAFIVVGIMKGEW